MATATSFQFKTQPMRHQSEAFAFAEGKPAWYSAMEMGTGKSKVAIDCIASRETRTNLIICPAAVLGVWRREFARHCPAEHETLVLDKGSAATKAAQSDAFLHRMRGSRTLATVVMNYETSYQDAMAKFLICRTWDSCTLDEAHRIKKPSGCQSKLAARLRPLSGFRQCLSGTPTPHSPLDIWAQFRFLDPSVYQKTYTLFRGRYAVCDRMFPSKVLQWIEQDEWTERFYQLAYRVKSADVLDLPSITHDTRVVALSPAAKKLYRQLEEELIADVGHGVVVASNALVKLLRLQQITSGYIPTENPDGTEAVTHLGDWKADALCALLEDMPTTEPVVVFCRFRQDLDAVRVVAARTGRRYGELSGRQKDLTPDATMRDDIDLQGVQIQSGGVGVDFTRAAYAVYFSVGFSLGDFEQSVARLHRKGQERPVRIYHLVAEGTVDRAVYGALRKRKEVVESVLTQMQEGSVEDESD